MEKEVRRTVYHVFIGAPGAGKGYIGGKIQKVFDVKIFSSGDLFRRLAKSGELDDVYCKIMQKGDLIPDNAAMPIIMEELSKPEWQNTDVILDGFPRTLSQAEQLDVIQKQMDEFDFGTVLYLDSDFDFIRNRVLGRLMCTTEGCNSSHNSFANPPKIEGICDLCGGKLIKRADDDIAVYDHRMNVFKTKTFPVVGYYAEAPTFVKINPNNNVRECFEALVDAEVTRK